MKKRLSLLLLAAPLLPLGDVLAENPDPLSRMIEKDYPIQGMVGVMGGAYAGKNFQKIDANATPMFYFGAKQLFDWEVFNTPIEFDFGRSLQFSLRNIEGSAWSAGLGLDYNIASIRERGSKGNPVIPASSNFVPGYDITTLGPYVFTRYQATHAVGIELSERLTENHFHEGNDHAISAPFKPKDYLETESRLLVDVDLRRMDPRPEVRDSGFYTGVYTFVRERDSGVYDRSTAFKTSNETTYGVGGLGEQLWQPWISGNLGIVIEGEIVANPDRVYLGETDGTRSQGHLYPHFHGSQNIWPGGSLEANFGPKLIYARFGQSGNSPSFVVGDLTLGQALSKNISVGLTYGYDADSFKETRVGVDKTGRHYIGASTMYHF
ncbi:hypothetical protein SAMN05444156_1310 [Verrucomicrobium sp. GAS474]|uniref:hypothetical protein n=1 Tax=Verrucomicrobium sp. GAS474 TaxID=1882831 RepID=UPI00087D4072|nr:hypothetical protein [Verrucomicrobium sp. GAS474]SDT99309.1 hypothetical protein SAMN05444156_1310 [Verrucomicrobium sp. GAS474]